jgi:hypothetical protein
MLRQEILIACNLTYQKKCNIEQFSSKSLRVNWELSGCSLIATLSALVLSGDLVEMLQIAPGIIQSTSARHSYTASSVTISRPKATDDVVLADVDRSSNRTGYLNEVLLKTYGVLSDALLPLLSISFKAFC